MWDLKSYIDEIVDPTVEDFNRNPNSLRHAFLACVAVYHAIDRAAYPRKPGNLKKKWHRLSREFVIVDMVAHRFKHVEGDLEKTPQLLNSIPMSFAVFGSKDADRSGEQMELRNLFFIVRDAVKFLRRQSSSNPHEL